MNKNKKYSLCSLLSLAALPFLGGLTAQANPVFSDDFTGGVGNWTLEGPNSMEHDSASEKFGNALNFTSSSSAYNTAFSRMYASFAPQTLSVGQTLQASVTYHGFQHLPSNNTWFVFGFMDNETDQLGLVSGIRADSRTTTGALTNFYSISAGSKIGEGDGGTSALDGRIYDGTPFNFTGVYDGESGSTGNIDDIIEVTFSITVLGDNSLELISNYHNLTSSESFSSSIIVESDQTTFGNILIGYQRRGGATDAASFEIGQVSVSVIPEPQHYTAMISALALGVLLIAKRRKA